MTFERHTLSARILIPATENEPRDSSSQLTRKSQNYLDMVRRALVSGTPETLHVLVESVSLQPTPEESQRGSKTRCIKFGDGEWFEVTLHDGYGRVESSLSQDLVDVVETMQMPMTSAGTTAPDDVSLERFLEDGTQFPVTVFDVAFEQFVFSSLVSSVHDVLLEHALADELLLSDSNYLNRLHDLTMRVRKFAP